jgi:enamine deaminase RidA (YjgF/YER057c/UK114 family)
MWRRFYQGLDNRAILFAMRKRTAWFVALSFFFGMLANMGAASAKRTMKQFLNLDGHQPPGYTHVVTSMPGKMIFISGRGGANSDGTLPHDFETQARNTFEDLKRCLALGGAGFKDVVKINYFVKDLSDTASLRKIRAQYLDMEHPPAATLVQAGLSEGALVEIEAIAMVPK